jgi:CRISPR-associated protein Csb1
MPLDFSALQDQSRLLIEVPLQPVQGTRFQPTGFPNLGAAVYSHPDGDGQVVLVESAQSMANRLEAVCWDEPNDDWIAPLKGLPVVKVVDKDQSPFTNSVLEAHRLNSEYIARTGPFKDTIEKELKFQKDKPFNVRKSLVPVLLKYDPSALLHGVFLEEVGGVIRLPRSLSAFIEAKQASVATSGGVKVNRVEPGLKDGDGNVIFSRDEYTSPAITAFFNLDLRQIRAFGLDPEVGDLLIALALFKIRRFLADGLRLRTACDLEPKGEPKVTRPNGFSLPDLKDLESALPSMIDVVAKKERFYQDSKKPGPEGRAFIIPFDGKKKSKKSEG